MNVDWTPIFVLPNVELLNPIECDIVALVPTHDQRVVSLKCVQPMFRRFLSRFANSFGEKFEPAVLLLREDAPESFIQMEALAGFRDLTAISVVAFHRSRELRRPRGLRVLFGDAFAIYPWMVDKRYEGLIGSTPDFLGYHEVTMFKGQSSASVDRKSLDTSDVDRPLLPALLDRWRSRYDALEPAWKDIALFRSLNMAYHASLMPAGTDPTLYDVGRLISLWVSAFEILVHPGGNDQVSCDKVVDQIEKTGWNLDAMKDLAYDVYDYESRTMKKRTLASWLYKRLYDCRNKFLHGNPVDHDDLRLPGAESTVFEYAAPLYRLALTTFLPLTFDVAKPAESDSYADWGDYNVHRVTFFESQEIAEQAILTAKPTPVPGEG